MLFDASNVRTLVLLFCLHDMVKREPFEFVVTFVNGRGVQANGLVIGNISETFTIFHQQLRVEAPSNNRAGDNIIITVGIRPLRNIEELPSLAGIPRSTRTGKHGSKPKIEIVTDSAK